MLSEGGKTHVVLADDDAEAAEQAGDLKPAEQRTQTTC